MTTVLPGSDLPPNLYSPKDNLVPGRKDDQGKLDINLVFDDCPLAIEAMAEVMQWAITKKAVPYARGSWQGVHPDRYRAAAARHLLAANRQAKLTRCGQGPAEMRYERDSETNLLHLAHRAVSAMFELELTLRELNEGKP